MRRGARQSRAKDTNTDLRFLGDVTEGLVVAFPQRLEPWQQELMDALHVEVVVDPSARHGRLPRMEAAAALQTIDDVNRAAIRSVDAHAAVETRFCKRPGCEQEEAQRFGKYGGLCTAHTFEAKRRSNGAAPSAGGVVPAAQPASKPASIEAAARALVAPSRRLDRAQARASKADKKAAQIVATARSRADAHRRDTQRELENAKRELQTAIDGFKQALG